MYSESAYNKALNDLWVGPNLLNWLPCSNLLFGDDPYHHSVGFDAKMTAGNQTTLQAGAGASSLSSTGMTAGASTTLLIAVISYQRLSGSDISALAVTWNSVSMSSGPIQHSTAGSNTCGSAIFYKINPTTGNQTLAATWTGGAIDISMSCITFTGTDVSTGINAADNQAVTDFTVTIPSTSDGATVASWARIASLTPTITGTPSPTTIFTYASNNPGTAASYTVGTAGTNSHIFTMATGSNPVTCGVHVIAPAAAAAVLEQTHYRFRADDGSLIAP